MNNLILFKLLQEPFIVNILHKIYFFLTIPAAGKTSDNRSVIKQGKFVLLKIFRHIMDTQQKPFCYLILGTSDVSWRNQS